MSTEEKRLPSEIRERLEELIKGVGGNVAAAEIAEVSPKQISRWRQGRSAPSVLTLGKLCEAAGKSIDWLMTGEEGPSQAGMVLVPVLSARFAEAPEVVEMLPVSEALLRWLRVSPADARLVEAPGPSWEPLARHGDVLLADASQRDPALGGLFLVRAGNFLSLQRVKIDPHGEAHTVEPGGHRLTPAELKALGKTVIGRILWIMRRAG